MEVHSTSCRRLLTGSPGSAAALPFLISHTFWFVSGSRSTPLFWETRPSIHSPSVFDHDRFTEAIFLAASPDQPNRQAEKDKVRSDIEYEVNIKAELEVAHLHEKTDRIYEQMMARFEKLEKGMA